MGASIFIATTGSGLARAERNAAGEWSVEHLLSGRDVRCLAADPLDPELVYAGVQGGGLLRSTDGRWVYEGGAGVALGGAEKVGGAAISRDAGATWFQPKQGLDRNYGWSVAADPARPEVLYLSVSTGPAKAHGDGDAQAAIFRRRGEEPWERLSGGLPEPMNYMPYALLTDPDAPGHLYAGLSNGEVWHSTDSGDSWQRLAVNLGGIHRSLIMI